MIVSERFLLAITLLVHFVFSSNASLAASHTPSQIEFIARRVTELGKQDLELLSMLKNHWELIRENSAAIRIQKQNHEQLVREIDILKGEVARLQTANTCLQIDIDSLKAKSPQR